MGSAGEVVGKATAPEDAVLMDVATELSRQGMGSHWFRI
jgi:hypothetical protein